MANIYIYKLQSLPYCYIYLIVIPGNSDNYLDGDVQPYLL